MKMENDLGRDSVRRLVWRIALPSMLAQFVSVLYSIVDRMYIGNIAHVGGLALAGVGVCGPVVTLVGSVAFLVGVGGAPLMSIRMGEGDRAAAGQILSNCFAMLGAFSLALMALVLAVRRPMLYAFGASDVTYPYASAYFTIYVLGTPFALLATGLNQFIICQGFARAGMRSVLLGAVLNIVLDPVFIFALGMGVQGGALATVLSQMASCAYVLAILRGPRVPVRLHIGGCSFSVMKRILLFGLTPFIIISIDSVMVIAMNMVLQRWGGQSEGDALVTCNTIVQSFMLIVTMPLGGISGGTQTVLSYNYGACSTARVRQAFRHIIGLCVGYTALMTLLARAAGPLFVRLFTQDAEAGAQAYRAICVCTLALVPLGLQYAMVDGLTAIGQVRFSLPLSLWRKTAYFSSLLVLPALLGARAAFYAEPVSDVLGPVVTSVVFLRSIGPILRQREALRPAARASQEV